MKLASHAFSLCVSLAYFIDRARLPATPNGSTDVGYQRRTPFVQSNAFTVLFTTHTNASRATKHYAPNRRRTSVRLLNNHSPPPPPRCVCYFYSQRHQRDRHRIRIHTLWRFGLETHTMFSRHRVSLLSNVTAECCVVVLSLCTTDAADGCRCCRRARVSVPQYQHQHTDANTTPKKPPTATPSPPFLTHNANAHQSHTQQQYPSILPPARAFLINKQAKQHHQTKKDY